MTEGLGKCVICGKEAGVLYPLLPGEPAFCSKHHNPEDGGPFGCDFTGPDDFDIPIPLLFSPDMFDRGTFVWTDKFGVEHRLGDIDDAYLTNIIHFLGRRLTVMDEVSAEYWGVVKSFLLGEVKQRGMEVRCG